LGDELVAGICGPKVANNSDDPMLNVKCPALGNNTIPVPIPAGIDVSSGNISQVACFLGCSPELSVNCPTGAQCYSLDNIPFHRSI